MRRSSRLPIDRVARLGNEQASGDDRGGDDRDVHDEHRTPPEVVEQEAADDRTQGDADAGGRGPDADGHRAFTGVGEDAGQQGQGRRHDERGTGAHDRPRDHELTDATGERRGGRRDPEDGEPEQQGAPPSEAVAERAREEQQTGEHERVRVDHPLELADVGFEVAYERRQRDVDDRVVDHDDQEADAQHDECEPATGVQARSVRA